MYGSKRRLLYHKRIEIIVGQLAANVLYTIVDVVYTRAAKRTDEEKRQTYKSRTII